MYPPGLGWAASPKNKNELASILAFYGHAGVLERRVDQLKSQGKVKGTAIQQAIATKMTYQNMLIMYKRFGLIECDK